MRSGNRGDHSKRMHRGGRERGEREKEREECLSPQHSSSSLTSTPPASKRPNPAQPSLRSFPPLTLLSLSFSRSHSPPSVSTNPIFPSAPPGLMAPPPSSLNQQESFKLAEAKRGGRERERGSQTHSRGGRGRQGDGAHTHTHTKRGSGRQAETERNQSRE